MNCERPTMWDKYTLARLRCLARYCENATHAKRLTAVALTYQHGGQTEAAREMGVTTAVVSAWIRAFDAHGPYALLWGTGSKRPAGRVHSANETREDSLSAETQALLARFLDCSTSIAGNARWTIGDLALWVEANLGVEIATARLEEQLAQMGYRPAKPGRWRSSPTRWVRTAPPKTIATAANAAGSPRKLQQAERNRLAAFFDTAPTIEGQAKWTKNHLRGRIERNLGANLTIEQVLLAHVLVAKYCDHLPLHRQAEIYAREDIDLSRSTMADMVGQSARLLRPLVDALDGT